MGGRADGLAHSRLPHSDAEMNASSGAGPRTAPAAILAVAIVLSACSAPGASPSPPSSAPPSPDPSPALTPAPTALPRSVAWAWQAPLGPRVAAGPDSTLYATGRGPTCQVEIHALRPDGSELALRWPYCVAGATYDVDDLVVDGSGSVVVSVFAGGPGQIVGLGPDGTPGPGWPAPFGWLVGALQSGLVVLTPSEGGSGSTELRAYGPAGSLLAGWPVTVPGSVVNDAAAAHVAPGDAVAVLYRDMATGHRSVTVIERDGSTRPGWPVSIPNDMDGRSVVIDLVTTDGRVVLRSHEPWPAEGIAPEGAIAAMRGLSAQVAVIRPDGTIPAGWPVRFQQPLSPLVESPAGRLLAVAGDVQYGPEPEAREPDGPYAVVSLEPDGAASPGWPVQLPDGVFPQPAETTPGPVLPWGLPPTVGEDGSAVVLIGGGHGPEGFAWVERDGTMATVHELPGTMTVSHGQPAAPGGPAIPPVIVDDRVFIAVGVELPAAFAGAADRPGSDAPRADRPIPALTVGTTASDLPEDGVLAVARTGAVAGWPVMLPTGTYVSQMLVDGGLLIVAGSAGDDPGVLTAVDPAAAGGN